MTMKELSKYSEEDLNKLHFEMACRGNMRVCNAISEVQKYYHKTVKVVKGRKVPIGVVGECFWMGNSCYGKYGDPWGIYSYTRIGIKDDAGNIYWTSLDNVELIS